MNVINRVIVFIAILLLLVILLAFAIAPAGLVGWTQGQLALASSRIAQYQALDPTNFTIARAAIAIAAVLILVPVLLNQFSRRKGEASVRLQTSTGSAEITTDSIARRLTWQLDQLADVISVSPVVRSRGDHVDVSLDLETSPTTDVPMKTEEVMLVTREVVEDGMGLRLGRLDVRLRHSAFPQAV